MTLAQISDIYALWNLLTLAIVGLDKYKARYHLWRIRENTLLGLALAMGGVGVLAGMLLFRHKTQHLKFIVGVPLLIVVNLSVAVWALK